MRLGHVLQNQKVRPAARKNVNGHRARQDRRFERRLGVPLDFTTRNLLAASRLPFRYVTPVEPIENELASAEHELDALHGMELAQLAHQRANIGLLARGREI